MENNNLLSLNHFKSCLIHARTYPWVWLSEYFVFQGEATPKHWNTILCKLKICSSKKMHISIFRLRIFREINARTNGILFTIMQICKLLFSSPSSYNSWMRCCCLLFCKWGAILACKINGQHDWRLALYPSKWNTKTRESYTWPNCTKISWF